MLKSTRVRRAVITPALGVLLTGIFSLGAGTIASANTTGTQAHPTGCTSGIADAWRTYAKCQNSNGGHYRAIANCKDPETGKVTATVGNWLDSGAASYAYCHGASRPLVAGFETKVS